MLHSSELLVAGLSCSCCRSRLYWWKACSDIAVWKRTDKSGPFIAVFKDTESSLANEWSSGNLVSSDWSHHLSDHRNVEASEFALQSKLLVDWQELENSFSPERSYQSLPRKWIGIVGFPHNIDPRSINLIQKFMKLFEKESLVANLNIQNPKSSISFRLTCYIPSYEWCISLSCSKFPLEAVFDMYIELVNHSSRNSEWTHEENGHAREEWFNES